MKQTVWNSQMASNFDIECGDASWGDWDWLKRPVVDTMAQVEKWDVLVKLITLVKKDNLIEVRAYFPVHEIPSLKERIRCGEISRFEKTTWCLECRRERNHDIDMCRVGDVMES